LEEQGLQTRNRTCQTKRGRHVFVDRLAHLGKEESESHWSRTAIIWGEVTARRAVRKQLRASTIGKASALSL